MALYFGLLGGAWASPRVVVSIAPVHSLVTAVMEGIAEPQLIYRANQSPHSSALAPSQVKAISNADVVVWLGAEFEFALGRLLGNFDPSASINLLDMARQSGKSIESNPHSHDHDHSEENQVESYGYASSDPHIWLSTDVAADIVETVAETLSRVDPDNQAVYRTNADKVSTSIFELHNELQESLSTVSDKPFIVYHDAYRYLEREFDLDAVAAVTISPEKTPGARHITEIAKLVDERQIQCVFSEPQFQPKILDTLVSDLGLSVSTLDPLGDGLEPGKTLWFELMRNLEKSLVDCLEPNQVVSANS